MITESEKKENFVNTVFSSVSDKYDLMNDLMSLGIHRIWKKNLIDWLSPQKKTNLIDNRKIIDCTHNGKCDIFQKGNLEEWI